MDQHREDAARRKESGAILRRLREETEPQVGAATSGMLRNPHAHFTAADVDPSDRIEVIGTRIGRSLGLVVFLVLLAILLAQTLSP